MAVAYYDLHYLQGGHDPELLDAHGTPIRPAKQGGAVHLRYADHALAVAKADAAALKADPDVSDVVLTAHCGQREEHDADCEHEQVLEV